MSDPNNIAILDRYLRRIYKVLADSFNVDFHTLKYNEVSKFATDYLRKDTMPSTCALDYYNKYLAKSTDDIRYSHDKNYDKFLHSVADHLETKCKIDKRKLAEFISFPQKCFEHYSNKSDAQWTAIDFYNSCSGDEIEYMRLKLLEYSNDEENSESVLDAVKFCTARLVVEPDDVQELRKLQPTKSENPMTTTRRNGRFAKEEASAAPTYIDNLSEMDDYNRYLNNVLDALVKYESIDKKAFAKDSYHVEHLVAYCRNWWYGDKNCIDCAQAYYESLSKGQKDALPKLNTQTTDEKEAKTMATDNQNTNAQNVPAVAPIKKIDAVGMMKVKMADAMFKKDGEIDYSKLMMMDAIGDDGKINLNKVIEAKMNGKIMKAIESGKDITLDKLMILQAMQGGQIDYNQIYMYKIIGNMLDDDDDDDDDGKKTDNK